MIVLKEVNEQNLLGLLTLKVRPDQLDQVDTNAFSIAQGCYAENAWYRGIYKDDVPVGFIMLHVDEHKHEYGLWRLMIDEKHQGKGYGKLGLQLAVDYVKTLPNAAVFKSAVVPKDSGGAAGFYAAFGFVETGKQIGKENGYEVEIALAL